MRYALISDIHGNLEALEAVLQALSKEKIDKYLCVGDIIGYGADPSACIKLIKGLKCEILIAGNHEWGVLGLLDLDYFNEYAEASLIWTRGVLNEDELDYLKTLCLVHESKIFTLVHGSLDEPEEFHYIFTGEDAYFTMRLLNTPLCFVGHSHVAGIFFFDRGFARHTDKRKLEIERDKKYVINIGSVGQPRDGDFRASFAVYDDKEGVVELKRAEYPVKRTQEKILNAGLPAWLAERLSEGR